jgi:hypothetical protein
MSLYPAQIDTSYLPVVVDNSTTINGTILNKLRDSILSIELELGIKPSSTFGSVRARLDNIENILNNIGPSNSVKLGGDLGGTNNTPIVIGIQGRSVSAAAPALNQVLSWNGVAWIPSTVTSVITVGKQEKIPVTVNGQTSFTLSQTPTNAASVIMFVNGVKQTYGVEFTVVNTTVTWSGFSLVTSDSVEFWYITNGSSIQESIPVLVNGQTSFTLAATPDNGTSVMMFVNGLKQTYLTNFFVSGNLVTWLNTFTLATTDLVEFWYM